MVRPFAVALHVIHRAEHFIENLMRAVPQTTLVIFTGTEVTHVCCECVVRVTKMLRAGALSNAIPGSCMLRKDCLNPTASERCRFRGRRWPAAAEAFHQSFVMTLNALCFFPESARKPKVTTRTMKDDSDTSDSEFDRVRMQEFTAIGTGTKKRARTVERDGAERTGEK